MSAIRILMAAMVLAVAFQRQKASAQESAGVHHYFLKTPHEPSAKWGYSGAIRPELWGSLDLSYRLASTGKHQSPINIDTTKTVVTKLPVLRFDYQMERISAMNNGHTIQHNGNRKGFLIIGDKKFALEQFHVHTPSEHTVDGKLFDLEIHFVHKSETGEVVVVGVLVEGDKQSDMDFPLADDLPAKSYESVTYEGNRDASDFLPKNNDYFTYQGSFTTPPCTEQVRWIVMKQPIGAPPKLIERFAAILKSNNRPVQLLNDRVIVKSE